MISISLIKINKGIVFQNIIVNDQRQTTERAVTRGRRAWLRLFKGIGVHRSDGPGIVRCMNRLFVLFLRFCCIPSWAPIFYEESGAKTTSCLLFHLPYELLDIIWGYCGKRLILNRSSLVENYLRSLAQFQLANEVQFDRLPPLYRKVSFAVLVDLYLFSSELRPYLGISVPVNSIKLKGMVLGSLLGPLGWELYMKSHLKASLISRLVQICYVSEQMRDADIPHQQQYLLTSKLTCEAIEGAMLTEDNWMGDLVELCGRDEGVFCPFSIADKGMIFKMAQRIAEKGYASTALANKLASMLMCLPGKHESLIHKLKGNTVDLLRPFPYEFEVNEAARHATFRRNRRILVRLRNHIDNVVRYGDEAAIDDLTTDHLLTITQYSGDLLKYIWGRRFVQRAWMRCYARLNQAGLAGYFHKLIFYPMCLQSEPDNSWSVSRAVLKIVCSVLGKCSLFETHTSKLFLDVWFRAINRAEIDCISLYFDYPSSCHQLGILLGERYASQRRKSRNWWQKHRPITPTDFSHIEQSLIECGYIAPRHKYYSDIKLAWNYCLGLEPEGLDLLSRRLSRQLCPFTASLADSMKELVLPTFVQERVRRLKGLIAALGITE